MSILINPFIAPGTPPPLYKMDDFNTLDLTTNWSLYNGNSGPCTALIRSGEFNVDVGSGSGVFEGIYSKTPFDITDKYVQIKAVNWSLASVNSVIGLYNPSFGNRIEVTLAAGVTYLAIAGGVGSTTFAGNGYYIKIRFQSSDSKFYISTSPDGVTFTDVYSSTSTLNPTSVIFTAYPYSFGGSGQTFIVDKFTSNVPA